MKLSFAQWMAAVNAAVESLAGVSCDDLADLCYHDLYDDEVSPRAAARQALKGNE